MRIISLIFVVAPALLNPVAAEEQSDLQERVGSLAPYVVARSRLTEADNTKLVYVALSAKKAYDEAHARGVSPDRISAAVETNIKSAQLYVDSVAFRTTAAEISLKGATGLLFSRRAPMTSEFSTTAYDLAVRKGVDALLFSGNLQSVLNDDDLIKTTAWIYGQASSSDAPLRIHLADQIKRYHGIDPRQSPMFDPSVAPSQRLQALASYLAGGDSRATEFVQQLVKPGGVTLALKGQLGALSRDVAGVTSVVRRELAGTTAAVTPPSISRNLTASLGAASAIAVLARDPETARTFAKLERLSSTIGDIAKLSKSVSNAPFALANPYLLAAVMVTDLLSTSSKGSSDAAILSMLREIQEQLRQMRELINERFDRVEYKLDMHFAEIENVLSAVRSDQTITLNMLEAIRTDLKRIELANQAGFQSLGRVWLTELEWKCFPHTPTIQEEVFRNCWHAYTLLASGAFDGAVKPGEPSSLPQANTRGARPLDELARLFSRLYPQEQPTARLIDPAQFVRAVYFLRKLKERHPALASTGRSTAILAAGGQVDIDETLRSASEVQRLISVLAVAPDGKLRTRLFDELFQSYATAVLSLWDSSNEILDADRIDFRGPGLNLLKLKGPNVLDFEKDPPVVTLKQFEQREVQVALRAENPDWMTMCPGKSVTLTTGSTTAPMGIPEQTFRFTPAIFNQLPGVVRWALIDGVLDARLHRCMAKAAISDMILGQGDNPNRNPPFMLNSQWHPRTAKGQFQIDLLLSYRGASGEHDIRLPSLSVTYGYSDGHYACANTGNQHRYAMALWNGGTTLACDGTNQGVSPAVKHDKLEIARIAMPQEEAQRLDAELRELSGKYTALARPHLEKVKAKAMGGNSASIEACESARAMLLYLVRNGLGGNSDALAALYDWVSDPMNMPGGESWVTASILRGASRSTIEAELESRQAALRSLLTRLANEPSLTAGYDHLQASIEFMEENN